MNTRHPVAPARARGLVRARTLLLALLAVALSACGPLPVEPDNRDALRNRADDAMADLDRRGSGSPTVRRSPPPVEAPPAVKQLRAEAKAHDMLPSAPADSLWGDAFGPTQHEAVRNARRVVSEQISARIESETRSFEAEYGDGRSESEASIRIKTTSDFDHAELIETVGVIRTGVGFTARAALDKRKAADVYAAEIAHAAQQLETLGPIIDAAIANDDASILLATRFSPAWLLAEQRRRAGIMAILGRRVDVTPSDAILELTRRAMAARAATVIEMTIEGGTSEALRKAVASEVGRILGARGCQYIEGATRLTKSGDEAPMAGPRVDARLQIASRDHEEHGMLWRYVGFELEMVDARNGKPVFAYRAMPEVAHGGGPNWAMADQAVARRLGQILDEKAAPEMKRLTCR